MKKQFFWLAVSLSTLCACTETDVIEENAVQSNAISFENVIKKPTRAQVEGDLTNGTFDLFSVYGYYTKTDANGNELKPVTVFNGDLVTNPKDEAGNSLGWRYDNTRYWIQGGSYYFYAYSCADVVLSEGKGSPIFDPENPSNTLASTRSLIINKYLCNADHQHDLICASAGVSSAQPSGNAPVKFTFKHALCKVSAEFISEFPQGYSIQVSDVKLKNFYETANLNVSEMHDITLPFLSTDTPEEKAAKEQALAAEVSKIWYGQTRPTNTMTEIAMTMVTEKDNKPTNTTNSVYMLPVVYDNANLQIEFTLALKQGDNEYQKRTIIGSWKPVWAPGKAYKYTIKLTGESAGYQPIVFEANQDIAGNGSWGEDISTEIEFHVINNDATNPSIN